MIVRVLGAFIAIFTFAVLQETPKKYLGCAGIVGAVGWLAYLLSEHAGADTVLATFISVSYTHLGNDGQFNSLL